MKKKTLIEIDELLRLYCELEKVRGMSVREFRKYRKQFFHGHK